MKRERERERERERAYSLAFSFDFDRIGKKSEYKFFGEGSDVFERDDKFVAVSKSAIPTNAILCHIHCPCHWSQSGLFPQRSFVICNKFQ
jgi:hypothetical protein